MPTLRMPTTARAGAALAVFFVAFAACLLSGWPNRRTVEVVSALSLPALALVFVPLAAMVAASARGRSRIAWVSMTVALASWACAESIWAHDGLIHQKTTFPSWAEAFYLLYVPAMMAALLLLPSARSWRGQSRMVLDGFILTGSFFLISWLAVLRSVWQQGGNGGLEFAVSLGYPGGDFLVLALAFLVLLRAATGLRLTLILLVAALACNAVADSVWVYMANSTGYTLGSLPDGFSAASGSLIIVALVAAYHAESGAAEPHTSTGGLALWLPLVPLIVAGVFVAAAQQNVVLEPPVVIGVVLLIAATLVRQVLEAAETVRREQQIRLLADQLATQLDSAAKYVASILPGELTGPVEVSSRYLPSGAVGGDSFGYTWLDTDRDEADHLIVYLIDVSGHGVEPALLSVSVHNLLRSGSLPDATLLEPDRVLGELNDRFSMDSHADHYFTMWYGVYQLSTGLLRYASAGHPPALALTDDTGAVIATPLGGGSIPVGMFDDSEFTVEHYRVPPGTRILLYSDGVLGDPPQMAEFVSLTTELAASSSYSLDSLAGRLPVAPGDDDCSLVQLAFSR